MSKDICATEGCGERAVITFERGGVASRYCAVCYGKLPLGDDELRPRSQWGETEEKLGRSEWMGRPLSDLSRYELYQIIHDLAMGHPA